VIILHGLGVPGLKRALILVWLAVPASLLLSCGSSSSAPAGSGLKFRAFISQDIGANAGIQILDAQKDVRANVAPIQAGATPGPMVVTPNRVQTLVFSPSDAKLTLISNGGEGASASITMPGFTESFVVSPDSLTAYVAVPTASVVGQSPGAIQILNLNAGAKTGEIDVPAVHFLALGHSGNRLLAFSDNSNSVAVITFGTGNPSVTFVGGFDRPVNAFFSGDDNTAYVLNCGAECGGVQAGVQTLDLNSDSLGTLVAACTPDVPVVCSGSEALLDGTTMYLAGIPFNADGTPFSQPCTGEKTAATSCGLLTVVDLTSMAVTKSRIVITDGFHNRIALGANGQLFVGAHTCTEIIPPIPVPPNAETRGCLSIYDTQTSAVVIPPDNGDVTGIQPISGRHVVYVAQGGEIQIYDTTTDKLQNTQIDVSGEVIDVKTVDF
jgi:hypothetical protein